LFDNYSTLGTRSRRAAPSAAATAAAFAALSSSTYTGAGASSGATGVAARVRTVYHTHGATLLLPVAIDATTTSNISAPNGVSGGSGGGGGSGRVAGCVYLLEMVETPLVAGPPARELHISLSRLLNTTAQRPNNSASSSTSGGNNAAEGAGASGGGAGLPLMQLLGVLTTRPLEDLVAIIRDELWRR